MMEDKENVYEQIEIKYDMPYVKEKGLELASTLAEAVQQKYDAFLATQLTLIAKEKGVSVADLCLRHKDITANYQAIDGQAIERMVLAMHNEDINRSIKDIPCHYRNLAEAALNALLEGK